jgi:hypothetical protein
MLRKAFIFFFIFFIPVATITTIVFTPELANNIYYNSSCFVCNFFNDYGKLCFMYCITAFGASVLYVFKGNTPEIRPTEYFLRKLIEGKSEKFYVVSSFILFVLIGSIISQIIFDPQTTVGALSAGVGWTGALNSMLTKHHS